MPVGNLGRELCGGAASMPSTVTMSAGLLPNASSIGVTPPKVTVLFLASAT